MSIWKHTPSVAQLQTMLERTAAAQLGITIEAIGEDWLRASMPVDQRTVQPAGLLHGGASCVLAETLGSIGSSLCVDPQRAVCVGLEINANHVRGVRSGRVTGLARPFHIGRRTQVWHIEIRDERERMVCVARLTTSVLERPGATPTAGTNAAPGA
jgi:1,4-dihydroxy-2-naphthoyl-CoA hydrolase